MKKIIESTQKVVSFAKKIKISVTIKLPFINVTFAPSILQALHWRALFLSTASITEQLRLVLGSDDLQEIALVTAFVKAGSSLGKFDEVVFCLLDLQHVHKLTRINVAGIEKEVMRRN